uniref:Uncharacterized protein n=1 Tax=Meloidogyne enterolobii TaxID=390850 RepID=A0A6V7UTD1_MELEN|nr:unnamed protein product [Meloidogyne enterolobii]
MHNRLISSVASCFENTSDCTRQVLSSKNLLERNHRCIVLMQGASLPYKRTSSL